MNRKDFISSVLPVAAVASAVAGTKYTVASNKKADPDGRMRIPSYLKAGNIIGICCPSGFITEVEIQPAILKLKEWGFQTRTGKTIGARDFTFAGNDELRAEDLQYMLDD